MKEARQALQALFLGGALALLVTSSGCRKPQVQVVPVEVGTVESTATSVEPGLVKSRHDSTLSPPTSGRIVEAARWPPAACPVSRICFMSP